MKIAYLLDEDISVESGVIQKIRDQIRFFEEKGNEVNLISLRSQSNKSVITGGIILKKYKNGNKIKSFFLKLLSLRGLAKTLKKFQPDIIYCRYIVPIWGLTSILKKYGYVVELNTIDVEEYNLYGKGIAIYNKLLRGSFLANANAFVSVTREIANHYSYSKFKKNCLVLGNGISYDKVLQRRDINNSQEIQIVFAGSSGQSWHGIDKILRYYSDKSGVWIHVIGYRKEEVVANLPNDLAFKNVTFYGHVSNHRSQEIISKCDVGIGTLALHRKSMHEACSLKVRQYLAQGLPVIVGYNDTDLITKKFPFILQLENYEDNVLFNLDKINNFFNICRNFSPEVIINSTEKILDTSVKDSIRLGFLEKVLSSHYEK